MASFLRSGLKTSAAALAAFFLQSAAVMLLSAAPAQAEMLSFWEGDNDKPSVTGNSRRASSGAASGLTVTRLSRVIIS